MAQKKFATKWLTKFKWLIYRDDKMYCSDCEITKKRNPFVISGCSNFRLTTLERHEKSEQHVRAVKDRALQKPMVQAIQRAVNLNEKAIIIAMRSAHYLVDINAGTNRFSEHLDYLKEQGCLNANHLQVGENATYSSSRSCEGFQDAICDVLADTLKEKINASPFISLMADESTDTSNKSHLNVYARIINESGDPETHYLENRIIDSMTANSIFTDISNVIESFYIKKERIMFFGSDGAQNMTGKKSGVGVCMQKAINPHLVHIHCIAHRLALCTSKASKNSSTVSKVADTLTSLYYYFKKSSKRNTKLKNMQTALKEPVLTIKQVFQVRWLAFNIALKPVTESWVALIRLLQNNVAENENDAPVAKKLLKELTSYNIVAMLWFLRDCLDLLDRLSKVFQSNDIDISIVQPMVTVTISTLKTFIQNDGPHLSRFKKKIISKGNEYFYNYTSVDNEDEINMSEVIEGNSDSDSFSSDSDCEDLPPEDDLSASKATNDIDGISLKGNDDDFVKTKKNFIEELISQLLRWFPSDEGSVIEAFSALDPRYMFADNSEKKMKQLLQVYGNAKILDTNSVQFKAIIDLPSTESEWITLKELVKEKFTNLTCTQLYNELKKQFSSLFPNILKLFMLNMCIPLHTAELERGFSVQNFIRSNKRKCIGEKRLNTLMKIKIQSKGWKSFPYEKAFEHWKNKKQRRILKINNFPK